MSGTDAPIVYQGSVKNLKAVKEPSATEPGVYLFEYTDDYSIFDWGKMPDRLKGKGQAMATLTAFFFEELEAPSTWVELERSRCWRTLSDEKFMDKLKNSAAFSRLKDEGLRTHYRGIRDNRGNLRTIGKLKKPSNKLEVDAVNIIRPVKVDINGRNVWDYTRFRPGMDVYLIPLENVFRFGIPKGSSLLDRLEKRPEYHKNLGLKDKPQEGDKLPRPILEYFSKLEPQDRLLEFEQAFNYSGLTPYVFTEIEELIYLISLYLSDRFARVGIEVWDGKFEFARLGGPVLVDAIGPDELRVIKNGVQISKEPLRQYHKLHQAEWFEKTKEAKRIDPINWIDVCEEKLNSRPEPMEPEFKALCEGMYQSLTNSLTGRDWFPDAPPLDEVVEGLKSSGIA